MSTPKKHHFITQCHLKNFKNSQGELFSFDKDKKTISTISNTQNHFMELSGNSKVISGVTDLGHLEKQLNDNFENLIPKNYNNILKYLSGDTSSIVDFEEALLYFTKYGIAGLIRHPECKKTIEDSVDSVLFNVIMPNADEELKKGLEEFKNKRDKTIHGNYLEYLPFTIDVLNLWEEVNYTIFIIRDENFFLLSDNITWFKRTKLRKTNFVPCLSQICFPISSKILLLAEAKEIKGKKEPSQIKELTKREVNKINKDSYKNSISSIICEDEEYLKTFLQYYNGYNIFK